ncbi:MAG: hypothetical protein E7486_02875 [Ruminococcaceae bacterium]|nr:hypothetical protein [Oscillospiraceae bacterium]
MPTLPGCWSFEMEFQVRGVSVQISFYFFAVLALLFLLDRSGTLSAGFLSCLCHEAGHLAAFALLGDPPKSLAFLPFGLRIIPRAGLSSPRHELITLLAGPGVNLGLFALFLLTGVHLPFAAANLLIGIFNLLPIAPLDGGRAILLLLERFFPEGRAYLTGRILSGITLLGLGAGGVWLLLCTGYNFSLLLCTGYLFVLTFCKKEV